jgi:hypothetical protein
MKTEDPLNSERLKELHELISLAEQSAEKIDQLSQSATRESSRWFLITITGYASLVGTAWLAFKSKLSTDSLWLQFALGASGLFLVIFVAQSFIRYSRMRGKLRRDLYVEREVQTRLVSIIHDNVKIAKDREILSPVATALIDMRIMRLRR